VDVAAFIGLIARERPARAARVILASNPLGGSCARVCPTELLCEGSCVLHTAHDRPVDIGRLQRYAMDAAFSEPASFIVSLPPKNGRSVAVIGGGPAGLSAAAFLVMSGFSVTLYDEHDDIGGLVRYAIAPYRLWSEPLPNERAWLEGLGVRFRLGHAVRDAREFTRIAAEYDAIVLAVGLGDDVEIHYPGDNLPGVHSSLPFIEAVKGGVPPAIGQHAVVIGGGNTAIDVAREAWRLGAGDVTLLYRRTEAEMPAYPDEVLQARREGIRFQFLAEPVAFTGTSRVTGVMVRPMRLGAPDASGRRRPEPVSEAEPFEIPADTVVRATGQQPRRAFLTEVAGLEMLGTRILVDPMNGATSRPRVFAAGDAVNGGDTVVEAVHLARVATHGVEEALLGSAVR
jgi:glutamate synthase (NADPH/NADH) small chain